MNPEVSSEKDVYVLEFDGIGKNFHIETIEEMLDKNLKAFNEKKYLTYVPLFIGTNEDCFEKMKELAILI